MKAIRHKAADVKVNNGRSITVDHVEPRKSRFFSSTSSSSKTVNSGFTLLITSLICVKAAVRSTDGANLTNTMLGSDKPVMFCSFLMGT